MVEHPPAHRRATGFLEPLDKRRVRRQFEAAAHTYDAAAVLQRTVADRLIQRLDVVRSRPAAILDAGCGTGYCSRALARRYPRARVIGVDLAWDMVVVARRKAGWFARSRFVNADAERLPFSDSCFDMVLSNFMLPWCDPAIVFGEFLRVTRPECLFVFTSFGPDTLKELRAAWDHAAGAVHWHTLFDMHDVGDALVRAGFVDPVMDVEHFTLTYADASALLRDVRALGVGNALQARPRGLIGRSRFNRFRATYEATLENGRLPATCEVVYGHAWTPRAPAGGRHVVRIANV